MKSILNGLLLLMLTNLYSQHTIEGSVKEHSKHEALQFVNVYLPQLEKGTVTDESGNFILNNIPSGNYKIIFSIIGYETKSIDV